MIIEPSLARLTALRDELHSRCAACGEGDPLGLRLVFDVSDDGAIEGSFYCPPELRSYERQIHGGVIALVLDCAMTNCLFAHGVAAVTLDLAVRFRRPLQLEQPACVAASVRESERHKFLLHAEITQKQVIIASAEAAFVEREAALAMQKMFC